MFRTRSFESPARLPLGAVLVLAELVLACVLSTAAVYQVFEEYHRLGDWLARSEPVPTREIEALRRDIGGRIIIRSVALAVLLPCTLAVIWLQQRQLAITRTLHHVRWLAYNILASLDEGVITTDPRGTITSMNSTAIELLGLKAECIGQPIASISSAEVPLAELGQGVMVGKAPVSDRELTLDRGGRVRRLVVSALDLKDEDGVHLGCVIHLRDITERALMREQLWRMEQFANLNTMAAGLHHEIKNPMTALSIHVQLLEERLAGSPRDQDLAEILAVLKAETRRLNITLDRFGNFARLQQLQIKPVDLREIVNDVARLIRPQAAQQHVRLELQDAGGVLPKLALDAEKIQQALLNLVLNALEAMPHGGTLTLGVSEQAGELRVTVRDTGPGIPTEAQGHILRPYFSTKGSGTGLGLTIAEKLIRQHDGQLAFRTGPDGTQFWISFPRNEAEQTERPQ